MCPCTHTQRTYTQWTYTYGPCAICTHTHGPLLTTSLHPKTTSPFCVVQKTHIRHGSPADKVH